MRRVSMLEADVFLLDDIVNIPPVVKWIAGLRGSHLVHHSIACNTMPTASNVAFKLLPKLHLGRVVFGSPGILAGKHGPSCKKSQQHTEGQNGNS